MLRTIFERNETRPLAVRRLALFAIGLAALVAGTGCRQQGGPGPERYAREIETSSSAARQKAESYRPGPPDRYPWQGRNTNRIEGLSDRFEAFDTGFRRESETHSQVIHGRRKHP
ncbi:MAG TPA: hypothetical protein PLP29_06760 [Candidatus Ozemobacteraceae bacterium]|nr:hypothetical protein [Candidatus Ozemobacteraceae bacterium]